MDSGISMLSRPFPPSPSFFSLFATICFPYFILLPLTASLLFSHLPFNRKKTHKTLCFDSLVMLPIHACAPSLAYLFICSTEVYRVLSLWWAQHWALGTQGSARHIQTILGWGLQSKEEAGGNAGITQVIGQLQFW